MFAFDLTAIAVVTCPACLFFVAWHTDDIDWRTKEEADVGVKSASWVNERICGDRHAAAKLGNRKSAEETRSKGDWASDPSGD